MKDLELAYNNQLSYSEIIGNRETYTVAILSGMLNISCQETNKAQAWFHGACL